MTQSTDEQKTSREGQWAQHGSKLHVEGVPQGAPNLNIDGRNMSGALQGFGQLWQKTYRVRLRGAHVTVAEVVKIWKENFPKFQPKGNRFYLTGEGGKPGEFLLIDAPLPVMPGTRGLIPMSSGVMVLYADDECFTVMTPEGFPESGWNTFSAFEEDGVVLAQVQSMSRASDPIYELGFRLMGGAKMQEDTWKHVLTSLAQHFGVTGTVEMTKVCVDPKVQWRYARNMWYNAGVRTLLYKLAAPLRWVSRKAKRGTA
ncbi:MAG: hypothetical protein LC737_00125 [Chloroflexi bacterium]|nr:hypothetical protein [Chloroflexota bacterium]